MAATVTGKGQVTIPKPVRDLLGIKPGSMQDDGRHLNEIRGICPRAPINCNDFIMTGGASLVAPRRRAFGG